VKALAGLGLPCYSFFSVFETLARGFFLITHRLRYAWTIIKMMVASKYQHIPQETNKLVFLGNAMAGLLIFLITLDVAMAGNLKIRDGAIWRIGFSSQLPLADYLPCVIYVNYIDRKNFVKRQFGGCLLGQLFKSG
jgi:cellulose synthase/poly-beta-1,6-N-acetylglucosamine synthase-like glycosyltransferase